MKTSNLLEARRAPAWFICQCHVIRPTHWRRSESVNSVAENLSCKELVTRQKEQRLCMAAQLLRHNRNARESFEWFIHSLSRNVENKQRFALTEWVAGFELIRENSETWLWRLKRIRMEVTIIFQDPATRGNQRPVGTNLAGYLSSRQSKRCAHKPAVTSFVVLD